MRICEKCGGDMVKNGSSRGYQAFKCKNCGGSKYVQYNSQDPTSPQQETSTPKPSTTQQIGMPIDEFRKKHDTEYIIKNTLSSLSEDIVYEKADVLKIAGLRPGYPGVSILLESQQFKMFTGKTNGVTYFGHPKTIQELKNSGIMF